MYIYKHLYIASHYKCIYVYIFRTQYTHTQLCILIQKLAMQTQTLTTLMHIRRRRYVVQWWLVVVGMFVS